MFNKSDVWLVREGRGGGGGGVPLTVSDKHLAKVLDELESSGYLAKLSEGAAVENVEEAEGEGPEGGADVVEEYDVIDDEDIPSTEQVQVGGVGWGGARWSRGGAPGDDVICVRVGCVVLPACMPTQHIQLVTTQP